MELGGLGIPFTRGMSFVKIRNINSDPSVFPLTWLRKIGHVCAGATRRSLRRVVPDYSMEVRVG